MSCTSQAVVSYMQSNKENHPPTTSEERKRRRSNVAAMDKSLVGVTNDLVSNMVTTDGVTSDQPFFIGGFRCLDLLDPMIVLSWNCRGLGQPVAIPSVCELVCACRPDVIFLYETLSHASRIEELRIKINFSSCFVVDCVGRSGGVCVLWKDSSLCSLQSYSQNHIDMKVTDNHSDWRLTRFYGFPERSRRRLSWSLL